MRVKTFRGSSTSQVMAQIKRELGLEAVILSNSDAPRKRLDHLRDHGRRGARPGSGGALRGRNSRRSPPDGPADRLGAGVVRDEGTSFGPAQTAHEPGQPCSRQKMAMEYLGREGVEESILLGLFRQLKSACGASLLAELGKVAG